MKVIKHIKRLKLLYNILQGKEMQLAVPEIANRFNVSRKTIYRDKELLKNNVEFFNNTFK